LKTQIEELFALRIPQLHRAVVNHVDRTLGSYMWSFVLLKWNDFREFADKPEFLRLVVQRLAATLTREGIEKMTAELYGEGKMSEADDPEKIHPAECYIKPPIGTDPLLGDVRVRAEGDQRDHLVVLWPSCDMVGIGGRLPKTNAILCAGAMPLTKAPEVEAWRQSPSATKEESVRRILKNMRKALPDQEVGSSDRYHFLPGVWDIPDLVVDFQKLEHLPLDTVKSFTCLGTLASPFAEALGSRFGRYLGRIGTPDLNLDLVMTGLKREEAKES